MEFWPVIEMMFSQMIHERGGDVAMMTIFVTSMGIILRSLSNRMKELKAVIPSLARQDEMKQLSKEIDKSSAEVKKMLLDLDNEYTERMKTWTTKLDKTNENVHRMQGRCESRPCLPHNSNWGNSNNSHS